MTSATRTTVYFDPQLHKALKIKAAQTGQSVSEILNYLVGNAFGVQDAKLSYKETFAEMAQASEDWSDFDALQTEGL